MIRPLHESAEGFSYMSKQGDSPDYECWQQLRECPAGAQQLPFERQYMMVKKMQNRKSTDHELRDLRLLHI